jgi:endonuclease/exonuclease/phosphatase family metal-dependent hydrolase
MRVATWNVHKCRGRDRRFDPKRTVAVLAELGADIVALQEVDRRFGRRTGLIPVAALAGAGLRPLPISELHDGLGWHGNAVLVRSTVKLASPPRRLDLPGVEPRGAVQIGLEVGGVRFALVATHLGLLGGCRRRQAAAILAEIDPAVPTLLMGDLNDWSPALHGVATLARDFEVPPAAASFPARAPFLALDRILGTRPGMVGAVSVHDTPLARSASDHLPLTAVVRL